MCRYAYYKITQPIPFHYTTWLSCKISNKPKAVKIFGAKTMEFAFYYIFVLSKPQQIGSAR